jgi:hypothetical protein
VWEGVEEEEDKKEEAKGEMWEGRERENYLQSCKTVEHFQRMNRIKACDQVSDDLKKITE